MRQAFIALVGHNASGKSFVAQKLEEDLGLNRVNADDFRAFVSEHIRYFKNLDISIKNERFEQLKELSLNYRFDMSWLLLGAGQSVIYDGSGATRTWRSKYLDHVKQYYPAAVRIIIYTDIPESELLKRLRERGANWIAQYETSKKALFEPPTASEAQRILVYNQHNYDEILSHIKKLLEVEQA
jgi:dephospho-CoA kinase